MTRYPAWRKHQIKSSWKSLVSVFLTITLVFALFSGLSKGFSLKNKIKSGKWDMRGPIVFVVEGARPAVFVYQKDSKKLTALALDNDLVYETGNSQKPLVKLSARNDAGDSLVSAVSKTIGANIASYAVLREKGEINDAAARELFKKFASFTTPFLIMTTGAGDSVEDTNITRLDTFRLWWQVKSISTKDVAFKDLSSFKEKIVVSDSQEVLGADSQSLSRELGKYLENYSISAENFDVEIINQSGRWEAAKLAANFLKSVGVNVVKVEDSDSIVAQTAVISTDRNSYTTRYLAKMFNCDTVDAQNLEKERKITLVLGQDFAERWYR